MNGGTLRATRRQLAEKAEKQQTLDTYKDEVWAGGRLKNERVFDAASAITCSRVEINGIKFHPFRCVLRDCSKCKDKYEPVQFESSCDDRI